MAKLMLPQIKDLSADSANPQGWTEKGLSELLGNIAKGMDVRNAKYQKGNVSSIPDVWAKPRLFEMLLFGKNVNKADGAGQSDADLRNRVVGEWRCILAMLALCMVKPSLKLEAEPIVIEKNGRVLEEVFLAVTPEDTIDEKTTWDKLYLLKYQGVPFAMTSPTTLVSVAADYSGALKNQGVVLGEPWAIRNDAGDLVLVDPTDKLDPGECRQISFWLGELLTHLRKDAVNGTRGVGDQLCAQLEDYQKALDARVTGRNADTILSLGKKYLGMAEGIFEYLDCPVQPPKPKASDSFVKIQPSAGKNPEKLWLFVDTRYLAEMAKEWHVDPNRMFVWMNMSVNDINDAMLDVNKRNYIGGERLIDDEHNCECEWVREEDFFTEHLYTIDGAPNIFSNVFDPGNNEEYGIVPPISKKLLNYFSATYIQENFKISVKPDNTVVAQFNLPFIYKDERGEEKERVFCLKKEYPEDIVGEYRKSQDSYYAPVAEVWPDRRVVDEAGNNIWKKYYFCYITPDSEEAAEIEEDILLLTPWSSDEGETDWQGNEIGRANKYIVRLKAFPEALICKVRWKFVSSKKEEDVGVLILKEPNESVKLNYNRPWEVGMDFGTSSTMLYYKQGTDTPKPLPLKPNLYTIINKEDRDIPLLANFIKPMEDAVYNGSFLSVYHPLKGNRGADRVEPLVEGHVLSLNVAQQENMMGAVENMVPNLKWSTRDGSDNDLRYKKKMVRAYIEQICVQTAFEAAMAKADKVTWKFSYPTAFSQEELTDFEKMIDEAVEGAMVGTPYAQDGNNKNDLPGRYVVDKNLWAESVAAATYFKAQSRGGFSNGAICLDIGAGTTDISVVSPRGSTILYHASVLYAGRVFFKPIFTWLENFEEAANTVAGAVSDTDKKKALLDAAMRETSKETLRKVGDMVSSGNDDTREIIGDMLQIPQVAMAGMFYYVGMIMKVLREHNIFQGDTMPNIFVGGNGARIFHWFCGVTENYNKSSDKLYALKQAILEASGFRETDFDVVLSTEPKAEVASGMLVAGYDEKWFKQERFSRLVFGTDKPIQFHASPLVAGEDITFYNGESGKMEDVLSDEFICAKDIVDGIVVDSLPHIENLLGIFNENKKYEGVIWGETIDIGGVSTELLNATRGYYMDERDRDPKKIHVEPVFLEAMESLVDILTDRLKEKL